MGNAIRMERPKTGRHNLLDLKLGYALMWDRRVPIGAKLLALALAIPLTALLELLELPVEGLIAALLSIFGVIGDLALDGVEIIAGPIIFSCLLLPFLAPTNVVSQVRQERSGSPDSEKAPIIDV